MPNNSISMDDLLATSDVKQLEGGASSRNNYIGQETRSLG